MSIFISILCTRKLNIVMSSCETECKAKTFMVVNYVFLNCLRCLIRHMVKQVDVTYDRALYFTNDSLGAYGFRVDELNDSLYSLAISHA